MFVFFSSPLFNAVVNCLVKKNNKKKVSFCTFKSLSFLHKEQSSLSERKPYVEKHDRNKLLAVVTHWIYLYIYIRFRL